MSANWYRGNAAEDGRETRGWILGHFIRPAESVRSSNEVEVKWAVHHASEKRAGWTADDQRTTLVLLVDGNFRVDLSVGGRITLRRQGDYVVWGPGIDHSWEALTNAVILTVRWPSSPPQATPDCPPSPGTTNSKRPRQGNDATDTLLRT